LKFLLFIDWDAAFEFVDDTFRKIKQAVGNDISSFGFRQLLNEWLQDKVLQVNFDKLYLLLICACNTGVYLPKLKEVLGSASKKFSLYLINFQNVRRKRQDFIGVLERIAMLAGRDYWWILFRSGELYNRQYELLRKLDHREVSESILKTLQENPGILLDPQESAARVVNYLIRWNEIDELYCNLYPIFAQNVSFQHILDPLLLRHLLICKTGVNDLKKILRSNFLHKLCKSLPLEETTDLSTHQEAIILFNEAITTIFKQKLVDVIRLACWTPGYLLPFVVPVVEAIVIQQLKMSSNFTLEEYRYFAKLEDIGFDNFPQTKQQIEIRLLKMTKDHVKSGSFQDVPSLKLILLGLAERKGIPFLERPKVADLQKAISRLPRQFFNNLHTVLKNHGISADNTLKPYRKGTTKSIVELLENHFDQLDEILKKIQNRQVPLIELSSLHVSCFLFFV